MKPGSGRFLTLEGVDGAGKSTHVEWIVDQIRQAGLEVVSTREPGGTPLGEKLRDLLLHQSMHLETETLLMFASRTELLRTVIEPALQAGKWVVCDRFTDATFAYQGGGRQLGSEPVAALARWVHPATNPDRTWVFDVPLELARERLNRTRDRDRFELEADSFFERTRAVYQQRALDYPERVVLVDSSRSIEQIRDVLRSDIESLIQRSEN